MRIALRSISPAFYAAALLLAAGPAPAGELAPYSPPNRQIASPSVPPATRSAPPQRLPDDTYRRFAEQTRGLAPAERAALARSFEQSRAEAARDGDVARELHYTRLLDSLAAHAARR
jgi:hypothetical protein